MSTLTFVLSGNKSDFETNINPPLHLDDCKQYEAALLSVDTYYSFPNITSENNVFKYFNGQSWKTIELNTGSYELSAINDEIQKQMIINGDYNEEGNSFYIELTANVSTLKSIVNISHDSYKVDFSVENSIGPTLGFEGEKLGGYHESQNIVDIMKINCILVNINIISGSYVNGVQQPVIYSFFPNVAPGRKIVERPNPTLTYYPLNTRFIDRVAVWLTDQNNKPIDLRGETLTVRIELREVQDIKSEIKQAIKELKSEKIL